MSERKYVSVKCSVLLLMEEARRRNEVILLRLLGSYDEDAMMFPSHLNLDYSFASLMSFAQSVLVTTVP